MTRETRIGLVIALVFIISFGLILSELTGSSSSPREQGIRITTKLTRPSFPGIIKVSDSSELEPIAAAPQEKDLDNEEEHPRTEAIALAAQDPEAASETDRDPRLSPGGERECVVGPLTHVVRPGDTLWGIARKFYGEGNEARYKEIVAANCGTLGDEYLLQVGQQLVIPGVPGAVREQEKPTFGAERPSLPVVPPPTPAPQRVEMDLEELQRYFSSAARSGEEKRSGRIYVVREGDNLTTIARGQLHDASPESVTRLYNANRDKIRDPDMLPVGIRLRIPK